MKRSTKIILFCFACIIFIGCDRITKNIAKEDLMNQPPQSFLHDTFRLEYIENTGAMLSLGDNLPQSVSFWLLSILPLIVLLVLLFYVLKNIAEMNTIKWISFAMIFAGGMGNIVDRIIFSRHVTDFMNVGIGTLRTGIFNVADMCVTFGAIGLLFFYKEKKNRTSIQ